jgi:hypothetical protein
MRTASFSRRVPVQRLESIGFSWTPHEELWEDNFNALANFKQRFRHCNVSRGWEERPGLATWCETQRAKKHKGKLSLEQTQKLDSLNFSWDLKAAHWEEMLATLTAYIKRFGHNRISVNSKEYAKLQRWCANVRTRKKEGRLTLVQIQELESLGFLWEVLPLLRGFF